MNRRATRTPNTQQQLRNAKPGDILLFYRANGLSRLITWFSCSRFYHVDIYAGDTFVVEARICGVVQRDLRVPGGGRYFRVIPAPQDKGAAALRWAEEQIGDSYAPLSVLALICDRLFDKWELNITQRNQFSCGELVVKAFAEAGVCLFRHRAAELTSPWDFARLLPRHNDCGRKSR